MAKAKKVSVNAFEKVVKENFVNTVTEEWFGIPVTITHTIPLKEVMSLVAEVADNCFLEDGRYMPEVMQPLLDCAVVERYTNISLPSNLAARYELVARSGIMDFIMPKINSNQYNDIVVAVRDRVDYASDSNIAEFRTSINSMIDSMSVMQEQLQNFVSGISSDDVKSLIDAMGDPKGVEHRVVNAYLDKMNESSSVDGDK